MKGTRKAIMGLAVVLLSSGAIHAQGWQHKDLSTEDRAQKQTDRMAEMLSLSAQQVTDVESINLLYAEEIAKIHKSGLEGPEKRNMVQKLHKDREADLGEVLTPEQAAKFQVLKAERTANAKKKRRRHGPKQHQEDAY